MSHHQQRDRFCYVQTPGIFECLNGVFGIENHLLYLALYPNELREVYRRQAERNRKNALNFIDLKADGIHVSDDWGAQKSLLFSLQILEELIAPYHRITAEAVKKSDALLSLHSDGCTAPALDLIAEIAYVLSTPGRKTPACLTPCT